MKRALAIFGNTALIFAAVACSMGAVISAFWFTVDMTALLLFWAVTALSVSLLTSFWRLKGIIVLLAPALALILLRQQEIIEGAKWVLYFITNEFGKWLYVTVLYPGSEATPYAQTFFFAAAGVVLSLLLAAAICLRRSTLLTVLFTAPLVFLSFVVVFNKSDTIYLVGLVGVYFTMLFSSALFPDDFHKRSVAIFPSLAVVLLLMGITYVFAPPQDYSRDSFIRNLDYQIRNFATRTGIARVKTGHGWPTVYEGIWRFETYNVGISAAGTREIMNESLLEITVDGAGTYYLRAFAMLHFNGRSWTVNEGDIRLREDAYARMIPAYIAILNSELMGDSSSRRTYMTIERTGDNTTRMDYLPYYSFPSNEVSGMNGPGYVDFFYVKGNLLDLYSQMPEYITAEINLSAYSRLVHSRDTFLQIEDSTAEGLQQIAIAAGIDPNADRAAIAEQVSGFFSTFGQYSLTPLIVPDDEDFALYFLRVSRQGYCIHYATAATLMLRALGIPARFTSGFVVPVGQSEVGQTIVVTDGNAHSWVEVFYEDIGWLPLEVTPPGDGYGLADGRPGIGIGGPDPDDDVLIGIEPDPEYDPYGQGAEWDAGDDEQGQGGIWANLTLLIISAFAAACLVTLITRRIIILIRRKTRFAMEDTNASVIFAWRFLSRLARLKTWQTVGHGIEDLANKARFSQHRLTEEERATVIFYTREFAGNIYHDRNAVSRFWVKFILGL